MNQDQILYLTYPGYRPQWVKWELYRAGWPASRRLRASIQSVLTTAYAQVRSELAREATRMSEDPFPGSSADFYEQIQVLKAEIERLSKEVQMMTEQAVKFRDLCIHKDQLITELCEALDGPRFDAIYQRELIQRAREGQP